MPDTDADAVDDEPARRRLPAPVNAASIMLIAAAVIGVLSALGNFAVAGDEEYLEENDLSATPIVVFGIIILVLAIAQAAAGVLVRRAVNPARIVGVVAASLLLALGILSLPVGIISAAVNGLIVYLLVRPPATKEFFARPAPVEDA